jgi:hypothetical protein
VVAELERAQVEGEVDGAGEQGGDGLHQRWPGIGPRARRSWRTKVAQVSAVAGVRAAVGRGDAVR